MYRISEHPNKFTSIISFGAYNIYAHCVSFPVYYNILVL